MRHIEIIEKLLKENKITAKKMLLDLGYSDSLISTWKKGSEPSAIKLKRIADYLNVTVDYILTGEEIKEKQKEKIIEKWNKLDNDEKAVIENQIDTIIAIKERKQGKLSS